MCRVAVCVARSEGTTSKTGDMVAMVAMVLQTYDSVQRGVGLTRKNLFCEQSGMLVTAVAGGLWT